MGSTCGSLTRPVSQSIVHGRMSSPRTSGLNMGLAKVNLWFPPLHRSCFESRDTLYSGHHRYSPARISGVVSVGGCFQRRPALSPVAFDFYCGNNLLPNEKGGGRLAYDFVGRARSFRTPTSWAPGLHKNNARLGRAFFLQSVLMLGCALESGRG